MPRRLLFRLIQAVLVLLVLSFVVYALIWLMPGDPIELMVTSSPRITPEDVARLKALYGVDKPLMERYLHWLQSALSGDLGYSRLSGMPVLSALGPPLLNSCALMITSLLATLIIALPLGAFAALRRGRPVDHALNLAAFIAISMPVFWLGLVLIMVFAVTLAWLPPSGVSEVGAGGLGDRALHLVLPVITLTAVGIGGYFRYMRAAMIGSLHQDWVRTARAKGLSWTQVVWRHALRNALIPVVTILALDFGALFSGVLVTENVFAYPGMGKLIYDAIMGNDYNLALAALLLATATTLLGSLLADIAYALLDRRVRFQ